MDLEFADIRELAFERPEIPLVFSELIERARRDDRIAAAILPIKKRWRGILAELLTEGVRDGAYRADLDPETFAMVMIASIIGFCRNRANGAQEFDRMVAELQRAMRNPGCNEASLVSSKTAGVIRHGADDRNRE
jgi:hypothetical protein